ncbi:MAG: hypothetical protein ABSH56_30825 [Bryobacteraceae bacterium]|jgi:hypothetical protein
MIRGVGIQPLFEGMRGQPQSLPSRGHLKCFKIQVGNGLTA